MLTQSQYSWLRTIRAKPVSWTSLRHASQLVVAIMIRHGLVAQAVDGSLHATALGLRALLQYKPNKEKEKGTASKRDAVKIERDTSGWIYYWAYGSNLSIAAMQRRCPGAKKIKAVTINDGALVFRGVADAVYKEGSQIHGGLWLISRKHERTLDQFEGVASSFYVKQYFTLLVDKKEVKCLYYQMNRYTDQVEPPSEAYLDTIAQGYRDFGLPMDALHDALHRAWCDKSTTEELKKRRKHRGGGKLAKTVKGYLQ